MTTSGEKIRGSVAWLPVLTGVVVALGAMVLLSAIAGGFLVVVDALPVDEGDVAELGVGGSIALVIGLFLSYLWGGYTAGRMARGQGVRTGMLVALGALLVAFAAAGAANAADLNTSLNVPWTSERLPIEEEVIVDWGVLLGLASLIAMGAGGGYGGYRGVRWHEKLESRSVVKPEASPSIHFTPRSTAPPPPEEEAGPAETTGPDEPKDEPPPGPRVYR